jgi:hypothetical protein
MDAAQVPAAVVVDVGALTGPIGSEAPAAPKVNDASVSFSASIRSYRQHWLFFNPHIA